MPTLALADTTLHYELQGAGPPVLLIQGVGVIGHGWRRQADGLQDRYTLCSFDNRGIGRSAPMKGLTTIEAMAGDARALLDQLGWSSAHVVGHSMGGLIAEQLALDAPSRVRSLALLCTPASGRAVGRPSLALVWLGLRGRVGTRAMRRRAFLEVIMPRSRLVDVDSEALAEQLGPYFGRDLADNPAIMLQQVRSMAKHDVSGRLGELAVPTLVLVAEEDRIAPPTVGRSTASRISGARYVELADAGHGVTLSHAERINAILDEHFRSVG
jgi:pimeloyl-ACP methyl ester carboxylesterase